MKVIFTKTELKSKSKIREKLSDYISDFKEASICYRENDIFNLVLSALRANEWNIVDIEISGNREKHIVDIERITDWIEKKVVPNTIEIGPDETDLLKLMIFSLAMPYKMLTGETRATMTEKVQRGNERYFGRIFSDIFDEKIGEIAFRKFAKQKFGRDINLDWGISTEISTFKSDIIDSKEIVSIKSTDTLESIWAEAPTTAEYGLFVKVALPKDFFLKILAHISIFFTDRGFSYHKLDDNLVENNNITDLVRFIEETAYGEKMAINGYICGFFKVSEHNLKKKGEELPYLGEVHEDKHLIECNKIMYLDNEWDEFFINVLPLNNA